MSQKGPETEHPQGGSRVPSGVDRRANLVLRALIDEMLDKLRELNRNRATWSEAEIGRAQAELEAIMARVRKAAVQAEGS